MKSFIPFLCLLTIYSTAYNQVDTTLGDNFMYEEVYQCGDQTKEQLYEKSKNWVNRTLKSGDNLIDFDEEEKSRIIVTGNILIDPIKRPQVKNRVVNFKLSLYFKEGRIKYILDNIIHSCEIPTMDMTGAPVTNTYVEPISDLQFTGLLNKKKLRSLILEDVDIELRNLLSNYKKSITSSNAIIEDDW